MPLDDFLEKATEFNDAYVELQTDANEAYREFEDAAEDIEQRASDVVELAREVVEELEAADLGNIGEAASNSLSEQVVEYIRRIHDIERQFASIALRAKQARRTPDLEIGGSTTLLTEKANDLSEVLSVFDGLDLPDMSGME